MNRNLFNSVKAVKPKRNYFDLSHDVKMSLDMGVLYPTMILDVVPGDSFRMGCDTLIRMAPMIAPIMHRITYTHHTFFVPYSLLWPEFDDWIREAAQSNAIPDTLVHPYTLTQDNNKYMTYFGLPLFSVGHTPFQINAMPFAAFNFIFNEYYRDQNLVDEVPYELVSGANSVDLNVKRRAWAHDYFTSALPTPQAGDSVLIPLYDQEVVTSGPGITTLSGSPYNIAVSQVDSDIIGDEKLFTHGASGAGTINDLRRADALQRWLERMNIGGKRTKEMIYNIFGVMSPDARLDRPEYIYGTGGNITISEVVSSAQFEGAEGNLPQGNMAGHGVGASGSKSGSYFVKEHGLIMSIMSVRPDPTYFQGIPKMYFKTDQLDDYYWPQFAHIGEQPIYNKELFAEGTNPDNVFGYTPRYSQYKYMPSRVAGDFSDSLLYWTLAREFETSVSLNEEFIECSPSKRIFAVSDPAVDSLYAHIYHRVSSKRPMPKFGTPMI